VNTPNILYITIRTSTQERKTSESST
jgi:hypothetical protein